MLLHTVELQCSFAIPNTGHDERRSELGSILTFTYQIFILPAIGSPSLQILNLRQARE